MTAPRMYEYWNSRKFKFSNSEKDCTANRPLCSRTQHATYTQQSPEIRPLFLLHRSGLPSLQLRQTHKRRWHNEATSIHKATAVPSNTTTCTYRSIESLEHSTNVRKLAIVWLEREHHRRPVDVERGHGMPRESTLYGRREWVAKITQLRLRVFDRFSRRF